MRVAAPGRGRSVRPYWEVAGATKFLKNWLTFAHSVYDPDHIFGPAGHAGSVPDSLSSMVRIFLHLQENLGIILKQEKQKQETKRDK